MNTDRYSFRGKVILPTRNFVVGDWVYGSLSLYRSDKAMIFTDKGWVQVDPETVGQYTGFLDKSGTKVFEGDIVGNIYDNPEFLTNK